MDKLRHILGLSLISAWLFFISSFYLSYEKIPDVIRKPLFFLTIIIIIVSIFFFIIDSFRRQYQANRALPIALAISGLISLGTTTVLYYLLWGRQPLVPAEKYYGYDFCTECVTATRDKSAGNAFSLNLVGRLLVGNSKKCPTCGSEVKTMWLVLFLPLIPTGSYRVIYIGHGTYISRKTSLDWKNVGIVYGAILCGILLFCLVAVLSHA